MKQLLFAMMLLPAFGYGQQVVLLDRKLKEPIVLKSEYVLNDAQNGGFPVYEEDIDSINKVINWLMHRVDSRSEGFLEDFYIKVGHTKILAYWLQPRSVSGFCLVLNTQAGNIHVPFAVANGKGNDKTALQQLSSFQSYLRNNQAFIKEEEN